VDKQGRTAKKVIILQTAMTKKGRQNFFKGKIGVTPSVAARGDTTLVTPLTDAFSATGRTATG